MILWKILGEFKFQSFDFLSSLQFLLQKADEKMTSLKNDFSQSYVVWKRRSKYIN